VCVFFFFLDSGFFFYVASHSSLGFCIHRNHFLSVGEVAFTIQWKVPMTWIWLLFLFHTMSLSFNLLQISVTILKLFFCNLKIQQSLLILRLVGREGGIFINYIIFGDAFYNSCHDSFSFFFFSKQRIKNRIKTAKKSMSFLLVLFHLCSSKWNMTSCHQKKRENRTSKIYKKEQKKDDSMLLLRHTVVSNS